MSCATASPGLAGSAAGAISTAGIGSPCGAGAGSAIEGTTEVKPIPTASAIAAVPPRTVNLT